MANSMPRNWQRRWHLRLTMKTGVRHGSSITWWALRCAPRIWRARPILHSCPGCARRWPKRGLLGGLASLAALGVIGWSALAPLQGGGFAGVPAQSQAAASAEPLVAVADTD